MRRCLALLLGAAVPALAAGEEDPAVLRWAGDPEGGAPFVEASPSDPESVVGFDVEIGSGGLLVDEGVGDRIHSG